MYEVVLHYDPGLGTSSKRVEVSITLWSVQMLVKPWSLLERLPRPFSAPYASRKVGVL